MSLLLIGFPGDYEPPVQALARQDRRMREIMKEPATTAGQIEELASDTAMLLHSIRRMLAAEVIDCPPMISISEDGAARINPARWLRHRFLMSLWCEFPAHQHRCDHPGYRFTKSREWFVRAEPYLARLSTVLQLLPIAGAVAAGMLEAVDPVRMAEMKRLKAEIDFMAATGDLFPASNAAIAASSPASLNEVAGFRAVRELLFELDPAREFAGLRRVVSESSDFLWVCGEHYRVYDPGLPTLR